MLLIFACVLLLGPVKKANLEETEKKSTDVVRKRKKEASLVLLPLSEDRSPPQPLSETTLTDQERLTSLVMRSYCRFGMLVQFFGLY